MPNVLIITSGALCRNPRVLKEATALGESGFDVTVATIANIERFEAFDRALLERAPFKVRSLDRVGRGLSTRLAGFIERAESWSARRAIRSGRETATALGPYRALGNLARSIPADLTIVHTELPFCLGTDLLAGGRKVAADFEDWHSRDLLPSAQAGRPLGMLREAEQRLMRSSAYTSAPSEAMASALVQAYGGTLPVVISNTFPLQPEPGRLPRQNPPAFFWFSQTIGEGRGLEQFIAGWVHCTHPSTLTLLGDVSPTYRDGLLEKIPKNLRDSLRFLPITSPEALPGVIAQHDIGLALEPAAPESRNLTATNKIFQYMNAGLAILATRTAGQAEVFAKAPGVGEMIDLEPAGMLAEQIDRLLSNPDKMTQMGLAARKASAEQYAWSQSSRVLVEAVTRATSR